jgi:hypothetical protein
MHCNIGIAQYKSVKVLQSSFFLVITLAQSCVGNAYIGNYASFPIQTGAQEP